MSDLKKYVKSIVVTLLAYLVIQIILIVLGSIISTDVPKDEFKILGTKDFAIKIQNNALIDLQYVKPIFFVGAKLMNETSAKCIITTDKGNFDCDGGLINIGNIEPTRTSALILKIAPNANFSVAADAYINLLLFNLKFRSITINCNLASSISVVESTYKCTEV